MLQDGIPCLITLSGLLPTSFMLVTLFEVTEPNYRACNGTKAIATYFSSNHSFTLDHPGHRYFLCGFPYHCRYGQKVEIYVVGEGSSPSPSPSPVADKNPANSASSSHHIFRVKFVTKYLAMVTLVLFYLF
ncbi:hypothetical protein PVK06_026527 [Gossypium arboreum]|uniref:Phytocyanin domain-containing protein n=1 Tax=Gossypium arboreum TaxID=29729 RepID=A0ABR0NY84_GOSAR|nr:hypothetical protein PVK06_026527 [Gossypium arboreum]